MGICNIKMYLKNKKGMLFAEFVATVLAAIIIVTILFLFSFEISSTKDDLEKELPELKSNYPSLFIHSFLFVELNNDQKNKLGIDNQTIYYVKDLVQENIDETTTDGALRIEIYSELRSNYLNYYKSSLEQYSVNMKYKTDPNQNFLQLSTVDSLDKMDCIEDRNSFYYLPSKNSITSELVIIQFEESITCQVEKTNKLVTLSSNFN